MRRISFCLLGLSVVLLLSGCVVRIYPVTKDRVDQDLSTGNRGYLKGTAPAVSEKPKSTSRTTQIVEIELYPPIKFEKLPKPKETALRTQAVQEPFEGNRGYITRNIIPEVSEPAVSPASFEKYTVQKGDTLQKISKKFYGTTKRWMKIYDANKDVLKGPNKVYPGQVLNIPVEGLKETQENLK